MMKDNHTIPISLSKRISIFLITIFPLSISVIAERTNFALSPFKNVEVSGPFEIRFSRGDTQNVYLTADDISLVDISVKKETLLIANANFKFQKSFPKFVIHIVADSIERIALSNMATWFSEDTLHANNLHLSLNCFAKIELASESDRMTVSVQQSTANLTGISRFIDLEASDLSTIHLQMDCQSINASLQQTTADINGGSDSVSISSSAFSKLDLITNCQDLNAHFQQSTAKITSQNENIHINVSSLSNMTLQSQCNHLILEASQSKICVTGSAKVASIQATDLAKVEATQCNIDSADVTCQTISTLNVCSKKLSIKASQLSRVNYVGEPVITGLEIHSAASINKISTQ